MFIPSIGTEVFVRMKGGDSLEGIILDYTPTTLLLKMEDGTNAITSRGDILYILIRPEETNEKE